MQFNKGFITLPILFAIIVIAGLALGGGAYWYEHQQKSGPQPAGEACTWECQQGYGHGDTCGSCVPLPSSLPPHIQVAFATSSIGDGIIQYINYQYGFDLKYPNSAVVNPDCSEGEPVCVGEHLIVFYRERGAANGNFLNGHVVVDATTSPNVVASCMSNHSTSFGTFPTTSINGIPFVINSAGGLGAGQYDSYDTYTTLHGGVCYTITNEEHGFAAGPYVTNLAQIELESIVKSFEFIDQTFFPGMSKYTDTDFGFSFWYPSAWTVSSGVFNYPDEFGGGTISKKISLTGGNSEIDILKYTSPTFTMAIPPGACGNCEPVTYYFDASAHTWMQKYPSRPGAIFNSTDVFHNTMGGLHIFPVPSTRFGASVIPLSARNFLYIEAQSDGRYGIEAPLVQTIVATDPSVATPVGNAEQTKIIQAEKDAYANQ